MRPPSVASGPTSASDYFTQPRPSSPSASLRPVLTPQIAPEFRVPTHEQAPGARFNIGPYLHPRPIRPRWEPDEATNECRRCSKRFGLLTRKHHCRRCGLVVCAACSQHNDALDPYTVALEPGDFMEDEHVFSATPRRYRTCSECHTALSLLQGTGTGTGGPTSLLSPQAFFPASPSLGSVTPSEAAASDVSELVECPVCGTPLASVGDKAAQETHIRDCLDTGGGTVSSGRYLGASLLQLELGYLGRTLISICSAQPSSSRLARWSGKSAQSASRTLWRVLASPVSCACARSTSTASLTGCRVATLAPSTPTTANRDADPSSSPPRTLYPSHLRSLQHSFVL